MQKFLNFNQLYIRNVWFDLKVVPPIRYLLDILEKQGIPTCSFYSIWCSKPLLYYEPNRRFRLWLSVFLLCLNHSVSVAGET